MAAGEDRPATREVGSPVALLAAGKGEMEREGDRPLCPEPGGSQVTGYRGAATGMT